MSGLGVVLAGGRSSRMGQNKAHMEFKGRSLLNRAQDVLAELELESVVNSPEQIADEIPDFAGPLAGISSVVNQTAADWWLILPVDMPLLDKDVLLPLIQNEQSAFYPYFPLPCKIKNTPNTKEVLKQLLNNPEPKARSVKSLLKQLKATELEQTDSVSKKLMNVNSPEDWAELEKNHGA